jgi:hypothetical protein
MNPYKLKHIPTGLYYQPHKHRGSNISIRGKIYQTETHGLSSAIKNMNKNPEGNYGRNKLFPIYVEKDSKLHKLLESFFIWEECSWTYSQVKAYTNINDWVIEEI